MNNRQLTLNSDRTKGVYISGRNNICLIDMATFKTNIIVKDELWGFYNSNPYFSPDDKYIIYNAYRDFETDIFVYNIASKEIKNLTNTKVSESTPIWSPNGKYLYFASDKINPSYPFGTSNSKIYQMALDKYNAPFKINKYNDLFKSEEKNDTDEKNEDKKLIEKKPVVKINSTGIMDRLTTISPRFGEQENPSVIEKDKKTYVLYISNHHEGKPQLWKTAIEPFEKNKTEAVSDKTIRNYQLVTSEKENYILVNGTIHTLDVSGNKLKEITINQSFNKSLSKEFKQMYYEAWVGILRTYL